MLHIDRRLVQTFSYYERSVDYTQESIKLAANPITTFVPRVILEMLIRSDISRIVDLSIASVLLLVRVQSAAFDTWLERRVFILIDCTVSRQ